MEEKKREQSEIQPQEAPTEAALPQEATPEVKTVYLWEYTKQAQADEDARRHTHKRGATVFAAIMGGAFTFCILLLVAVLIWQQVTGNGQIFRPAQISTEAVAETVLPSTVLVISNYSGQEAYGTGFFITEEGHIATNAHVVEGATSYEVILYGGERIKATLVDIDAKVDLALLKISAKRNEYYPPVLLGDSSALRIGNSVVAVGNPGGTRAPFSVTGGIISALERPVGSEWGTIYSEMEMIQTDAALNSGNSGGPLCNARGEIIGIITRKSKDQEGIAYAIPINEAWNILSMMLDGTDTDKLEHDFARARPRLGFQSSYVTKGDRFNATQTAPYNALRVEKIEPTSAAASSLRVGDLIFEFDGKPIASAEEFIEALYSYNVNDLVSMRVLRNGKEINLRFRFYAPLVESD